MPAFLREMLKSKIHRVQVTHANLHYEGSISIDSALMETADILAYEKVEIYNITNGKRFSTYAIPVSPKSGIIQINGAAAHKAKVHDLLIIASYATIADQEMKGWKPKVVKVDENNQAVPEIVNREI